MAACFLAGTVKDHDARRLQRAAQLFAADDRIHGAHLPHQQGLSAVRLSGTYAGQSAAPVQGLSGHLTWDGHFI